MPMTELKAGYNGKFVIGILAVVTIGLGMNAVAGQAVQSAGAADKTRQSEWVRFSPPDRSFVVEAPANLRRLAEPLNARSPSDLFGCAKSADAYEVPLASESNKHAFVIGVFNITGCECDQNTFKEEVKLFLFSLGGDNKRIVSDVEANVDGFPSREIVYENGDVNGRVLLIKGDKRIYLVMYTTDVFEKTSAPEILRIFKSFRPLKVS